MQNIRVSDLLIGQINNEPKIAILTGKLVPAEDVSEILFNAVDLEGHEYNLSMKPIFESYFVAGGPFSEYIAKNVKLSEVFANSKIMEIIKKEKYDEISLTEIKALDLLVKKTMNFNSVTNDKENEM